MSAVLTGVAVALLVAALAFVLNCHWHEQHGDNHF